MGAGLGQAEAAERLLLGWAGSEWPGRCLGVHLDFARMKPTPAPKKNEAPVLPPDVRPISFLSSWLVDWCPKSEAGVHLPHPSPCLTAHLQFIPRSAESPPTCFSNLSPAQDLGILTVDQPTPLPPSSPPKMHLDLVLSPSCPQHPVRRWSPESVTLVSNPNPN